VCLDGTNDENDRTNERQTVRQTSQRREVIVSQVVNALQKRQEEAQKCPVVGRLDPGIEEGTAPAFPALSPSRVHLEMRIAPQQILHRYKRALWAQREAVLGAAVLATSPALADQRPQVIG